MESVHTLFYINILYTSPFLLSVQSQKSVFPLPYLWWLPILTSIRCSAALSSTQAPQFPRLRNVNEGDLSGCCSVPRVQFQKDRGRRGKMFVHPRNNLHQRERSHRPSGFLHGVNASYQIKDARPKKKLRDHVSSIQSPVFSFGTCTCMWWTIHDSSLRPVIKTPLYIWHLT